jgi:hypothetical protein
VQHRTLIRIVAEARDLEERWTELAVQLLRVKRTRGDGCDLLNNAPELNSLSDQDFVHRPPFKFAGSDVSTMASGTQASVTVRGVGSRLQGFGDRGISGAALRKSAGRRLKRDEIRSDSLNF